MNVKCPHCGSHKIQPMSQARQSGSALGGLVGIAYGLSSLFRGARAGAAAGSACGPVGITLGGVIGAVVSAAMTGTAGFALGAVVGDQMDKRVLKNHQCEDCGGTFKIEQVAVLPPGMSPHEEPTATMHV